MAKYTIKNGIYMKDGKPTFPIGVSYYASYHERKVPVPPEADRFGELEKDIKGMRDFGFNIVRCAALGDISYGKDGDVVTDTPLLDAIADSCNDNGIGLMLRLQGYSMNLSGYTDTLMVGADGKEMDKNVWYDFVRDCLFHDGLTRDNDAGTEALAKHFVKYPSVVGWQTYNEPHYPSNGIYDYHPKTVKAYRKWLVDRGFMTVDEARDHEPPRKRPAPDEPCDEWIRWRTFSHDAMTDFLCHSSDVAKTASGLETMTCITSGPTHACIALRGEDFFRIAEGMDALGITQYFLVKKPEVYFGCMNLSMAESAAALAGKPLWIVEYDAKTDTPPDHFQRNSYLALGTGIKGLLYYQWRGDHVYPDSPEGNGFGIINYDGTKTANFENAKKVVSFINGHSDLLLDATKHRSGVGILRSFHGLAYSDARDNVIAKSTTEASKNRWRDAEQQFFREMAKNGVVCDFVRSEDLKDNRLGIRVLFVPFMSMISDEEMESIKAFETEGGKTVFTNEDGPVLYFGYNTRDIRRTKFAASLDADDVMTALDIKPLISFDGWKPTLLLQTLDTSEGYLAVITNIENLTSPRRKPELKVPNDVKYALLASFDSPESIKLKVKDGKVSLPEIDHGCFVRLIK